MSNRKETTITRIILVRHGQTEWNRVERFRGRADVPLNEVGLAQAQAAGRRIVATWQPVAVHASPLSRAVRTAEAIAGPLGLPVALAPDLVDIDYGQWQGLTPDEARQRWPDEVQAWYEAPHTARIPGGETLAALQARAMAAVGELAARYEGQTIVLVSHTVVNRAILLRALGAGLACFWRLRQDNGALNILEVENKGFTLVTMNDTCHLQAGPM